jgi:DNA-binding LacI/PurR family transcriptional regulator
MPNSENVANIKLKDIASLLGISISTVSKALNNRPDVNTTTKAKVIEIANSLNFKPNHIAAALRSKKSYILGVILPDLKDTFFLDSLIGITEESSKYDYKIMVYQTCNNYKKEIAYTKLLSECNIIDGLIFSSVEETLISTKREHLETIISKGLPIVYIENKNNITSNEDGFITGQNCVRQLLSIIRNEQLHLSA